MNYLDKLLPTPFVEEKYQRYLPHFLSQQEHDQYHTTYTKLDVYYELNTDGYRTQEWDQFDWSESIAIFGCSHVFGEGVAEQSSLPWRLQCLTGRRVINLGVPGTGPQFSWHNSLIMNRVYPTPYAVIQLWSNYNRIPYYGDQKCKRIGPWSGSHWDDYDTDAVKLFALWNLEKTHSQTEFAMTSYASRHFWSSKTKYVDGSFFEHVAAELNQPHYQIIDYARDGMHGGFNTHSQAAFDLYQKLEEL